MKTILCRYCSDPIYRTERGWEDPYNSNYAIFCGANPNDNARHGPETPNYTGTPGVMETIAYLNGMPCTLYVRDTLPASSPKEFK